MTKINFARHTKSTRTPEQQAQEKKEYQRAYYQAHKEEAKEYQREYARTHKKSIQGRNKKTWTKCGREDIRQVYTAMDIGKMSPEKLVRVIDRMSRGEAFITSNRR